MSTGTKTLRVPAQLRKHVLRTVKPSTKGNRELLAACEAGARELEAQGRNNQNSIDLELTNEALGVLLGMARGWLDSDNGNEIMAAKSMLKFELEYEPDDPREIRHAVKMPNSAAGLFTPPYTTAFKRWSKDIPEPVRTEYRRMSWASNGLSGRITNETLGWFLEKLRHQWDHPTPAVQRAVRKFIKTYTEPYEQTQRLINGYLGTGEDEDQAPEPEPTDEPAAVEPERKRLVIIACGGKKSPAPGAIPADERYTGNYFRACLMAAEVMDGPTMILSAKYGLIPLTEEIPDYNVKMGEHLSVGYAFLFRQAERLGLLDAKVTVLGGQKYVSAVREIWPDAEAPLKGGIGQQLKQLAGIYQGEALEDDEDQEQKSAGPYPYEMKAGQLREVPGLPSRYSNTTKVIWFGGKAGRGHAEPGKWVKVKIIYTGDGRYDLTDLDTGESVMMCTLVTKIHWAPGNSDREFDQWQQKNRPEEVEAKPAAVESAPPGGFEVPPNFLELAAEGNTPQARAYWRRRCEEYRKTGK
ncbi:hypothetical protein HKX69_05900 [Streptomyces argyrophyllae]|uniref:DUF6884 domain-containing protein n=1 Tax=Streptomyces argyrophylli TaxID=2726118 RepID=A0A6M4PEH1_9ACTN|nr:DUF6884 domain-containing protein [Streptomyces argyrophyllae]QJS09107.1 hypothetical protein HKX69_05900 [Streptomyces argyrophyllae]